VDSKAEAKNAVGSYKFRVTADEKSRYSMPRAKLMWRSRLCCAALAGAFAGGRIASRPVLDDLVAIRSAANALAAVAGDPKADPIQVAMIAKNTADALREIAARHLAIVKWSLKANA
jgi:hypothetical protein